MFRKSNVMKVFLIVFLFTVVVSPAMASNWNITSLESPYNNFDVSNNSETVQLVNLETEQYGTPISEDMLTDSSEFNYLYNSSEGAVKDMQHLKGGLWYAVLNTDLMKHSSNSAEVLYNASGVTKDDSVPDSNTPAEERQVIRIGNYSVEVLTQVQEDYIPGSEQNFSLNVTNLSNGDVINSTKHVQIYFTNGTWRSQEFSMEYNETQERWINESVQIPDNPNSTYVMRALAYNRSAENAYGGTSTLVDTVPELEGEIAEFDPVNGCSTEGEIVCEPGAEIMTVFNVTAAEAENVELNTYKVNSSSGNLVNLYSTDLSDEGLGIYTGGFAVPEVNTTVFEKKIIVRFNATKAERSLVKEKIVDYRPVDVTHTGSRSASQGSSYDLTFQTVRPFSFNPLGPDRLSEVVVNVTDPQGDLYGSYYLDALEFVDDTSSFKRNIDISEEAPTGGWSLDFGVVDEYGYSVQAQSGFSVGLSQATFDVNDTVFEKNDMEVEEFELPVENLESSNLTLEANLSQELEGEIAIGQEGEFNVSADNVTDVPVTVNLTEFSDVNGTVNLTDTDSGYEKSIRLVVDTPDCFFESGDLCSLDDKWLNVTAEDRGVTERDVDIFNNAEDGNSTNFTAEASGNISELVSFSQDNYTVENRVKVPINYTVEEVGLYTGNLVFNATNSSALVYNTSLETNFSEIEEPEFSVSPEHIDLGAFPEGESRQEEVRIGNTGDLEIENISADSQQFDVSLNSSNLTLSAESTETVQMTFEEVTSSEGNLTISGNTSEGLISVNMTANATPLQNYAERTDELTERARDLRPVQDSNLSATLNDISGTASNIETAWDSGNYLEARDMFRQAQRNLDYVANNKQETTEDDSGSSGDDSDEETGDQGGTTDGPNDDTTGGAGDQGASQNEESGGGLPIIPIVAVLAVLLIIGFVFYESYIPEEGDPLYGVLGDQ